MENFDLRNEYFFKGNDVGCLLIHGFISTPAELRELGERVRDEGYTVLGVRLAGHGTDVKDMKKSRYTDWINSVVDGYERLRKICTRICIIGHSMGGLLGLYIAENYSVDKIAALAPAVVTKDGRARLAPVIKIFIKYKSCIYKERTAEEAQYLLGYKKFPVNSVCQLSKLQKKIKKELYKVATPILIIQSHNDKTVDERGVEIIEKNISSSDIKKVYLDKCGHNITVECEKEVVFNEVIAFLKENY